MYYANSEHNPELSAQSNDDQFAGFVGIETYCRNYQESFSSKTKLHKHLRVGCKHVYANEVLPARPSNSDGQLAKPSNSKPSNSDEQLAEPSNFADDNKQSKIIKSTASNQDLGNNFTFRS